MTIVFKYSGRAPNGLESWAQVAVPYVYSKNLPDFMMFKVQEFRPRTNNSPGNTVVPGVTRFPAYKVREVGGGFQVNNQIPTDPHSTMWVVSGVFPTYSPYNFAYIDSSYGRMGSDASGQLMITPTDRLDRQYSIPPLEGLIGDLEYPTQEDINLVGSLGLPVPSIENVTTYRLARGSGSFVETPFQQSRDYMLRYKVRVSDYTEIAGYPSEVAAARTNMTALLPQSLTNTSLISIQVLEESPIRKVLKVKARTAFSGIHIFSYYYLYRNSDFIPFSTKLYYSDRLGAKETHPTVTGKYNPLMKKVHEVIGCAQAPMFPLNPQLTAPQRIYENPSNPASPIVMGSETLRDSFSTDNPSTEINPDTNEPFRFSFKFYGDYQVGASTFWGPSTGAADTKINYKVNYHKWLLEGAGTYWHGILWNPGTVSNVFENEQHIYGIPAGTYIWAKGGC